MPENHVIVTSDAPAPDLPTSHPPTPKFLALAMTARQNEQGDRITALDRRMEGHDARSAGLDSRLGTCAGTAAAAREAAEQAMERASREALAPDHTRANAALATAAVALLIVALRMAGVF